MKRKNEATSKEAKGPPYGRQVVNSFLIRVQLCEERIRMQLTDVETRVGVVLDLLRARCPGYRIEALYTFDGCELEELDKIIDVVNYGEYVVVAAGRTSAERMHTAALSSFGLMSCLPRPCIASLASYVCTAADVVALSPCVVPEDVAKSLSEIFVAINGQETATVMVPVRLRGGTAASGCPRLVCRGGIGADSMHRIPVVGGKPTDSAVLSTVGALQEWVRGRSGVQSSWCRLYTHIIAAPLRAVYRADSEKQLASLPKQAASGSAWWGEPLEPSAALPVLEEGQRLVVCTKSYGITVTGDIWPSWKCMPLNLTGPARLQAGDAVVVADPVRHEEVSAFLLEQQLTYPWLKFMQRCGTEMLDGSTAVNDEVSFSAVMSHAQPPNAQSAGRIALKIVARVSSRDSINGRTGDKCLKPESPKLWKDESVWAALPAHAHVLSLLFTAGPQVLFCPYMDTAPVAHWLTSSPVQALSIDELMLVFRTLMLHTAMALQHFHDHGALHLEVTPDNLMVRPCGDMRKPLWMRMHVLLADYGLSSRDYMAGSATRSAGGASGYWPPEQVPVDTNRPLPRDDPRADVDRWGDSDKELQFAFEMFVETVYVERERQLHAHKNTELVLPDFPRLRPKAWEWFRQLRNAEAHKRCDQHRPMRAVAEDIEEELQQVLSAEDLASRRLIWREAVRQSLRDEVVLSERADSFSLAMTMLHLISICIRSRVNSPVSYVSRELECALSAGDAGAHGKEEGGNAILLGEYVDQLGGEWHHLVNDELACVIAACLRLRANERMLASKVAWHLSKHPAYAQQLWHKVAVS